MGEERRGVAPEHALDELADQALNAAITDAASEVDAAYRLARFLGGPCGFRGNIDNYYDPANSYLSRVIERRVGIPITLSLLLIEVGQRLGLPMVGIGMPTHFLTACTVGDRALILLDMFAGGVAVTHDDCRIIASRPHLENSKPRTIGG